MPEISKAKIRKLPYNSRLNLALMQDDYISEVGKLFEDYPNYEHSLAQTELMKKCGSLREIVKCFKLKYIDFPHLIDTISKQIVYEFKNPPQKKYNSNDIYNIINKDVSSGISKFDSHPYYQEAVYKIINSLLECYQLSKKEEKHTHAQKTIIFLVATLSRRFGMMPGMTDEVARQLLPDMGDTQVMNVIKTLLEIGVHDESLRNLIYDSINIRDIIT